MPPAKPNSSSQNSLTRNLGPSVRICHINIENISYSKSQYLSKLLKNDNIDLVAIQETHCNTEEQLQKRGKIPGYELLGATYHHAYGTATYIRHDIENATLISTSSENEIHNVVVKIGSITVSNIYKPPAASWPPSVIQTQPHPAIYVGDFNSHHEQWKYRDCDENGIALVKWAEDENLHLAYDAKDRYTFKSAAWRREYNPDLCFTSIGNKSLPLPVTRKVLCDFPHSQHRPVIIEAGSKIPLVTTIPRPRWNFKKAKWEIFSKELDKCLGWIPATSNNYNRFVGAVTSTAKKCIPRGYRKEYIPGWSQNSEELYQIFLESGDQEIADELLHSLDAARQQKWSETVESMNFQTSSRQAWSLLRKLGSGAPAQRQKPGISPNAIASHIAATSRAPKVKAHTIEIKRELRNLKHHARESIHARPVTLAEIETALKDVTPGKAPGFDNISPEFLIHCGKHAKRWMAKFFTDIIQTGNVPKEFKQSKVIAILKPGKPANSPKSYRPIALLSVTYKLLERVIYNRISPTIFEIIPVEQAGFRPKRSCVEQVLSLTTRIEAGFQRNLKTSAAFIDLSAAYDTVWREGLVYKLLRVIPCKLTARLLNNMLNDRTIQVITGSEISSPKKLKNGLPQGSVLAPLLFSLYIADMPDTKSKKYGYADDWALTTSCKTFEETEVILSADLKKLGKYFRKWRLQPNASKTEITCFHLNNKSANRELRIQFENKWLTHNKNPKYLGVILDRTLSFKEHLTKTAEKLKTRNNIIQKLTGTTWGASASTLRSSALGLVFSAAEYCAPAWLNSPHAHKIDTQLNNAMRLIAGVIKSTPTEWLPVLSHIHPPNLRRVTALTREYKKILANPNLPIHEDIEHANHNRLRSRKPPTKTAVSAIEEGFDLTIAWHQEWTTKHQNNRMPCITQKPPGYDLPRKTWSTLNRIRTQHGRCAYFLHKWGKIPSPLCECGENQTVKHITEECNRTAYEGTPEDFQMATPESIAYINSLEVCL